MIVKLVNISSQSPKSGQLHSNWAKFVYELESGSKIQVSIP